jgi:hypothetical protein
MNLRAVWIVVPLFVTLSLGCAVRRIPGTEIQDTPDTREILQLMENYRSAVEAKDANRIVQLVAESFKDDAGTGTPEDDLDYASLRRTLPDRLSKVDDLQLEMSVRQVTVVKDAASAIYYYNTRFRMPHLTTKPVNEGDLKQMFFKRIGNQWKIVSGI